MAHLLGLERQAPHPEGPVAIVVPRIAEEKQPPRVSVPVADLPLLAAVRYRAVAVPAPAPSDSSPETPRVLTGHEGWVQAVAVTRDGHAALSAGADRTVRVWDLATGQTTRVLTGHNGRVNAVAVTGDGRFVSGSEDRTVRPWGAGPDWCEGPGYVSTSVVQSVAVSATGGRLVVGLGDGRVVVFAIEPEASARASP